MRVAIIYIKIFLLALGVLIAMPGTAAVPTWEVVETFQPSSLSIDDSSEKIEATARDGYIYVTCPKPVTVKIMSILGQQISQAKLPAGISRIKISSRGIYILQAGDATIRIAI